MPVEPGALDNLLNDPSLRKALRLWLPEPSDVEDVLQAVAEKLVRDQIPVLTKGYLYTVLRNSAIDLKRSNRRRERNVEGLSHHQTDEVVPAPEHSVQAIEAMVAIQAVLERQPPLSQRIFHLYHTHNRTQPEIAELLDVHISTVEKRLAKVRKACISEMRAHLD